MFTSGMGRRPPETYADLKHRNYTMFVAKIPGIDAVDNYDRILILEAER
jgi:hypothetical protein